MFSISRISVDLHIDTGIDVLSGCMEQISYQKVQEYGKKIRSSTNNVNSNGFVRDPGLEFTSKTRPAFTLTHLFNYYFSK